jgi:8-oxo-dGTP pyrophosphatase MutT (NUDIX family)
MGSISKGKGDVLTFDDARAVANEALKLTLPYFENHQLEKPSQASGLREAAVLVCLGRRADSSEVEVLVLRRTEEVPNHKGQMAFPGGAVDLQDQGDFVRTALREAHEEVGLFSDHLNIIGVLPSLPTLSKFWVTPILAFLTVPLDDLKLQADGREVAEFLWVPWSRLLAPGVFSEESWTRGSMVLKMPVYEISPAHRIWGATATILHQVRRRFEKLKNGE